MKSEMNCPSLGKITLGVIAIHLLGFCAAYFSDSAEIVHNVKVSSRQFVVQTISLSPSSAETLSFTAEVGPILPPKEEEKVADEELVVEKEKDVKPAPPEVLEKPKEEKEPLVLQKKIDPKKQEKAIEEKIDKNKPEKKVDKSKPIEKKPPEKKVTENKLPEKKVVEKKPVEKKIEAKAKEGKAKLEKTALEQKKKQELEEQKKKNEAALKLKEAEMQAEKKRQLKLLSEAQEKIAKIDGNRQSFSLRSSRNEVFSETPTIKNLQIDAIPTNLEVPSLSSKEMTYRNELAAHLKLYLKLPAYGDVKLKLTLNRAGRVISLVVTSAGSEANRKYIEKQLPQLKLPGFGSNFGSDSEYTFSITLSNE